MFLLRRAKPDDLGTLLKLAKTVHFINLPADKDIISEKIRRSRASFRAAANGEPLPSSPADRSAVGASPLFMFVLEDVQTGNCLGTSMVVSRMGGPEQPNLSFVLRKREFFSTDLQSGAVHITAKLLLDESGPSEIGGLIVGINSRRHPAKLGKQLSLVRFHYMGLHREQFSDRVLAEMMAPITPDGHNTLWEYLGRRFINLSYSEADKFCQHSREFMTSLLPREEIYLSLLPPEARALVGQVGPDTVPARKMLEDLGFAYTGRIDPFDGGPHLEASTDDIALVRDTSVATYAGTCRRDEATAEGFASVDPLEDGSFRAVHTPYALADGTVRLPAEAAELIGAEEGGHVGLTPCTLAAPGRGQAAARADRQEPTTT